MGDSDEEPDDAADGELGHYPSDRPAANIMKALSLVPEEAEGFFDLVTRLQLVPIRGAPGDSASRGTEDNEAGRTRGAD